MMGGRERKIGLQIRVVAALGPPQSTIHLAFELHQSPTRPTTTGLHENARWQFLQLSPRATRKEKVPRCGCCRVQRYRSFVRPGLLGGGTSSWVQSRSSRRHPARCDVHKSRGEEEKAVGAVENEQKQHNQPISNTYHSLALFSFQIMLKIDTWRRRQ